MDNKKYRLILDVPFSSRSTISYGLIVYAIKTKKWAIIQRKHSVEFLLFFRGIYRLTHLPLLLSSITQNELNIIKNCVFEGEIYMKYIYLNVLDLPEEGLNYSLIRMKESAKILSTIINNLDVENNILKWTWPKGRLYISNNQETPFDCAKREFMEEVEIDLPPPLYISDNYISENIKTLTGRNIESRYWIYVINDEITIVPPVSHPEVSNRLWVDTTTCLNMITHKELFTHIISIVNTLNV